jgi:hypothetical protein
LTNAAAFLGNNSSILDMNDPVREWQQTRIMCHNQHGVSAFPGDLGQQLHDRLAIRAIKCRRRLVRENDGRISDDGARDRDPLLFAAAQFARIRLDLVGQSDLRQCLARADLGRPRALAPDIEREPHIVGCRQRRKQVKRLEHKAHMLAPEARQLFGVEAGRRMMADANRSLRRRQHASKDGQQRRLAAPGRPPLSARLTPLSAATLPAPLPSSFVRFTASSNGSVIA